MAREQFDRRLYTKEATPIEYLARFSEILGGPNIYIKCELLGLTGGAMSLSAFGGEFI